MNKSKIIKIEKEHSDIMDILKYQSVAPFAKSIALDNFLDEHWKEIPFKCARTLFFIGYIEGKRAERNKRKVGKTV